MESIGGVNGELMSKIRARREWWERKRRESPDTICTVYTGACSEILGAFNVTVSSRYIYDRLTGGFIEDDSGGKGFDESCPCLDMARRTHRKAKIANAVESAVSRFGVLPSELAKEMTFETYLDNPDWCATESELAYRAWVYCKEYAADPKTTPFLALFGGYGSGKTHLAMSIAQRTGEQVVWANCADLFAYLKTRFKIDFEEEVERIKTAGLLVLDDLGANRFTPWADEKLYEIVNHRHQGRMPTVITTNFNMYEANPIDGRLLTRMTDLRWGYVFNLNIQDNRRMLPRREYREWPDSERKH